MKLKEYIKQLQEICGKYPDVNVVSASDDEGNDFNEVGHSPTLGFYRDREFVPQSQFADYEIDSAPNSVCLN